MTDDDRPTVLVVDDEQDLADLYAAWLGEEYEVRTAYGGEAALEAYDETVDVVLLDRRMPRVPGDEVLEAIRDQEGEAQVVMVTAVDPDFDILEMGFDGYVTKPVGRDDLTDVVERMLTRLEYDDSLQRYYQLVAQRAALGAEKSEGELAASEEFNELQDRIEALEADLDSSLGEFEDADFEAAFRELN